jgi:hypothetical protein
MRPEEPHLPSAREAMLKSLPEATSLHGAGPELRFTYLPASHAKALNLDVMLVVGMRGAGKSFWWAALQRPEHRLLVHRLAKRSGLTEDVEVTVGFGERPDPGAYPGRDVLDHLLTQGHDPRLIWRTVILHALAPPDHALRGCADWPDRVAYVAAQPEAMDNLLYHRDQELDEKGGHWLILFDALDLSASDWPTMKALIRGLLQAVLDLRRYRRLRAKCFLRTDQLDERAVTSFPDASKILAERVELTWPDTELYNLLWQYLGNARGDAGEGLRRELSSVFGGRWSSEEVRGETVWMPPNELRRNGDLQRRLFHAIAGPWMGKGARRGYPYTWVPNHLADAQGKVSPRSFLAALRKAAEDTDQRYPDHEWPLHYESIKQGVQAASGIRVDEMREDYPWVDVLMEPLRGKVVPCDFEELAQIWHEGVLGRLETRVEQRQERLPPTHLDEGPEGLRRDLEELGVFLHMRDGRVNIPDVFRVGYGLGRKGGVRPIQHNAGR